MGYRKPPETERPGPTVRARPLHVERGTAVARPDRLATEEPLEILVQHRGMQHNVAVTMRTPGNDFELATGFLYTEGMIASRDDVAKVSYCASGPPEQLYNVVTVELASRAPFDPERMKRNSYMTSSCGVCGKASLESVRVQCARLDDGPTVDVALIAALPDALRARQKVFDKTGGLHAAGSFDPSGSLIAVREDVGRHNAVDKLIGSALLNGTRGDIMMVSGRASFEIVQKAAVARIPIVAAVSAPSSLAVSLAQELGMTLVGFIRGESFNIYAEPSRIRLA
ncbi:MAG: formate dehydrogenase accessory sulfurtransferase FdhD [Actinomycetota bacterium]